MDQWLGRGCGVGLTVVLGAAVEVVLKVKLLISAKFLTNFFSYGETVEVVGAGVDLQ